jgi:hypothetical protein
MEMRLVKLVEVLENLSFRQPWRLLSIDRDVRDLLG